MPEVRRTIAAKLCDAFAVVAGGVAAGLLLGAVTGYLLAPGGVGAAWRSAALGSLPGLAWGVVLVPVAVWLGPDRRAALRQWAVTHGRGVAVALFCAPIVVGAASAISLIAFPKLLVRVNVPEVSVFVSLVGILGATVTLSLAGVLGGTVWARRAAPPAGLGDVLLKPLLASAAVGGLLVFVCEQTDSLAVSRPLVLASRAWDIGSVLVILLTPVVTCLCAGAVMRWHWLGATALLLAAGLVVALGLTSNVTSALSVPGLRRTVLLSLQGLFDGDHDGYARYFGGGDCDDSDARVHPFAVEIPGNGRDEDCEGGDLDAALLASLDLPDPMTPEVRAALEARIPKVLDVVLLMVDAMRADLHYAGNPLPVSPNLDRLAQRAVVFTRAYAPSTFTTRSTGSIMTGRYADELARTRGGWQRFGQSNVFLAERLRDHGWSGVLVPTTDILNPRGGLTQGFDVIREDVSSRRFVASMVLDDRVAKLAQELITWPPGLKDRYFLWADFGDPHEPYIEHPEVGDFGPPPAGSYWQEVAWSERQVGRVIDAIDALPAHRRNNTLVIVTADHGESLGEHNVQSHGTGLWEEQMRVPLLVWAPGLEPRRVDTPRSIVDLVPTVLDLLRVPYPPATAPDALSGKSLVPDLLGFPPQDRPVYAELPVESAAGVESFALVDRWWKLYQRGVGQAALYDLRTDPHEGHDLSREVPAELARMRALLSLFRARLRSVPSVDDPPAGW